jgi:hypothetical protein
VTLHVPFRIVKRGGRKEMQMPEGATQPRRTDNTLVKALARAFRWKRMLESGEFATIAELAEREGIAPSYMTRVLRPDAARARHRRGDPGREAPKRPASALTCNGAPATLFSMSWARSARLSAGP